MSLTPAQHAERRHARTLQHRHEQFDAARREMLHCFWQMLRAGEHPDIIHAEANRTLADMRKLMIETVPERAT